MITRVRHSPPRVDQAPEWLVVGRTLRRVGNVIVVASPAPLDWFIVNTYTYSSDDALYLVLCDNVTNRNLHRRDMAYLMRYFEQMGLCCLPMCDDLKWKLWQFLR
jgi:hypothetical protein